MDTVRTLAPFKGSLEDFKSFWQMIDEARTNETFRPFVDKFCPDVHRDLHSWAKLWKEHHDHMALGLMAAHRGGRQGNFQALTTGNCC